jgi:uncharacterized protein YdeI (YjbR/CyaY-like superfamily)
MANGKTNPKVDWFFDKATPWQEAYGALRTMLLSLHLTEELKWGCPSYTHEGGDIVLIHGFKEYCALLFFKGALLKDPEGILIQQTKNVQSARQIRFTSAAQIVKMKKILLAYVRQALEVEKSGQTVVFKKTAQFEMPDEFKAVLDEMPEVKTAFEALTPGRQRAYLLYFSAAKQAKTRQARVEKCVPAILDGKGLDD